MKIKRILLNFVLFFILTFAITTLVNFLWNLIFHGDASVSWETSFRFALILGIIFTWMQERGKGEKKSS